MLEPGAALQVLSDRSHQLASSLLYEPVVVESDRTFRLGNTTVAGRLVRSCGNNFVWSVWQSPMCLVDLWVVNEPWIYRVYLVANEENIEASGAMAIVESFRLEPPAAGR